MKPTQSNSIPFFRLAAGWCGLLLYVGACSPLSLGLATLVGSFDRNHQLQVHPGAQGLQLVLHHAANCLGHHHGLAARALAIFAQPTGPTDSDHVLQFTSADNFKSQSEASMSKPKDHAQGFGFCGKDWSTQDVAALRPGMSVHSPPEESVAQACLRSILILI